LIIVDTCVTSELMKPSPSTTVTDWVRARSATERTGTPIDGFDAQIAAICRTHGAALATRNVEDFQDTGIEVIDPWHTM
jgi:predicted nucleic acid-binding protein